MDKPLVDPIGLVGYLLAEFDGSERMASEIRRVISLFTYDIKAEHSLKYGIDAFLADLEVLAFKLSTGASDQARVRLYLWLEWASIAIAAKAAMHRISSD